MIKFYLLFLMVFTNFAIAYELTLPVAKNFFTDSQKAWENQTPILIMFSIPNCEYCEKVKEDVIGPMADMDEYRQKIIIRHINANSFDEINNFYNEKVSHNEFAFQRGINFFPTVLLVDQYGIPLEKMIGALGEDYYWTDLDKLIISATDKIIQKTKVKL